ncbi:MAG: hypothetical protein ACRDF5_10515 [bacterium]
MRFLPMVLVLLLAGTSPVAAQGADDRTVVPGVRIGKWTLMTSIPELLRMNGPASSRPSVASTLVPAATWYSWDSLGIAAGTHDRRFTAYLAVYDGDYAVPRGVGIRASRNAVLTAHGEPTYEGDLVVQGGTITLLAYDKIGLAYFLQKDVVQVYLIFHPGNLAHLIVSC